MVTIAIVCPEGSIISNNKCEYCPPGWSTNSTNSCHICGNGTSASPRYRIFNVWPNVTSISDTGFSWSSGCDGIHCYSNKYVTLNSMDVTIYYYYYFIYRIIFIIFFNYLINFI